MAQNEKKCTIVNGQFSYLLEVDGHQISFSGGSNADYFAAHYKELGYTIERVDAYTQAGIRDNSSKERV